MPYYVTKQENGMVSVVLADASDDMCLDSNMTLRPDQMFHGRPARDLEEGVYDLKGTFLYDWEENRRRQLAGQTS